jgi:hypothetical protein
MTKKTKFKTGITIFFFLIIISISFKGYGVPGDNQQYYEIRIYQLADRSQEAGVDDYLKNVYLPALHRAGIPAVGVFKPVETDTACGKLVYVFIPFKTINEFSGLEGVLENDEQYCKEAESFRNAPYDKPPYKRLETVLLKAFGEMPQYAVPDYSTPLTERIYELRSYESATEATAKKKIEMFNSGGEIAIFQRLGFQPVFFAQVLAGSHMPNLMYMITFTDMKSHDEHWKTFVESEEWKTLSAMEEYNNTVSHIASSLLHPTSYSDF